MVEAEKKAGTSTVAVDGSEGLFAAIKDRGQVMDGFSGAGLGSGALADFDKVLKQLDKEGSIEENMLFLNRELALDIDDMLASVNGSTQGGAGTGASYGLFNNESDMALNLGFSGFRRGSYDFYKSDWKYLNDASTRGVLGMTALVPGSTVEGVLVPAGTSTVYDQILGQNIIRKMSLCSRCKQLRVVPILNKTITRWSKGHLYFNYYIILYYGNKNKRRKVGDER